MLMKAIALDDICSKMVRLAEVKNYHTLHPTEAYSSIDKYGNNRCDYEFFGIYKFIKSFNIPVEIVEFDFINSELSLINKIVIDGEEYEIATMKEILSAIETHKKFMEYSGK